MSNGINGDQADTEEIGEDLKVAVEDAVDRWVENGTTRREKGDIMIHRENLGESVAIVVAVTAREFGTSQ